MKLKYLLLFLLAAVAVYFLLGRLPSGHSREIRQLQDSIRFHVKQAGEFRRKADSLDQEIDLIISHYVRLQASYLVATQEGIKWEKRYHDEKKRKTGILTDAAYDSVLNRLYPR